MKGNWSLPSSSLDRRIIERLNGATLLVTGATGVVGLNLLKQLSELVASGELDLRLIGASKSGVLPRAFQNQNLIEMVRGDLLRAESTSALPEADYVIHGATYGQPAKFQALPVETVVLNTAVTAQLLEKTRSNFLFLSSSEVYSGLERSPFSENQIGTTNTDHARAAYIESKRCGEALTLSFPRRDFVTNVARLSLAYGPGAHKKDKRVLYELILRGLREHKVSLRGNGTSLRSYLFVSDAVKYLLGILLAGSGGIYNVGGDETISLNTLATEVAKVIGVPVALSENTRASAPTRGAPDVVSLDMSKTKSLFEPFEHVELNEGLSATVEWFRQLVLD